MTYYIYATNFGSAYITETKLSDEDALNFNYSFINESEEKPNLITCKYVNNQWVDISPQSYIAQRANAYPKIGDQLDMFWHAMDNGVIPKIEPFYTDIKTVKETYPKT